jgi:hypothetical protein
MSTETGDPLPELTDSESDEEQMVPALPAPPIANTRVLRVRLAPVTFKAPAKQTAYQRYNNDESYRTDHAQQETLLSTQKSASTSQDMTPTTA